jgi:SAM-dependent methyltransferase
MKLLPRTRHPVLALRERAHRLADRLLRRPYPDWYASDNQFPSRFRMDRAHAPVVTVASAVLAGRGGAVLDLGCGNGALLRKIHGANPGTVPFGIDIAPASVAHAGLLLPAYADHFIAGDIFAADAPWADDRRYALVVLAPTRLLETNAERGANLRERLRRHCDTLVVYAYGNSLTRHGDLAGLCRATGLRLLTAGPRGSAGVAAVG